ncbi:type I DNA topoisomerase [candidate division GN15 bacterium]|nr:type I DNA topoisomerase [candidate division GN15 bacterium]
MAKNLLIVESPAKTRTLSRILGKDFNILATLGHICDLPKSKLGIEPENNFSLNYQPIKGKEDTLAELEEAAREADTVYLAPDPDREGEAIAWHVASQLESVTTADLKRVTFNEITEPAVLDAIENPRELNLNKVNAQQARRALDRLVGYTVSPFLWKTIARNLSAGRVQSVALRLVCERETEINGFTPREYWNLEVSLTKGKRKPFTARLYKVDGKTVVKAGERGKNKITISSKADMGEITKALGDATLRVDEVKTSRRRRQPAPPFITSTLQQEAARKLSYSPKQTMGLAQKLYEGVDMGGDGPTGLITYMRTDSVRVSDQAIQAVREHIENEFGVDYLPTKPVKHGTKKSAQDAHEAIRPTYLDRPPQSVRKLLKRNEYRLYKLIWERFLASQMKPAEYEVTTATIAADKLTLRASAQKQVFDGFLKVYQESIDSDEAEEQAAGRLPKLKDGDELTLKKLNPVQSFTKPPGRFSEASLVKQLEKDGIGRPSTYASIITTLKDRRYVELTERRLQPTDLGEAVNRILVDNFPDLFNVGFTADMELQLDQVEQGDYDWVRLLGDFYGPFMDTIDDLKDRAEEIKESMTEKTDEVCEKCGLPMIIKWGRNGRFLACSGYPDCRSTRPLPEEEERNKTNETCEKCGAPMVIKVGRFGRFMACSAYPDCKNTKPVTLDMHCPKSDCNGKVIERQTRSKRLFYGCSKYPKCDFASWDLPVDRKCPVCDHDYMVFKNTKSRGEHYRCPECKHTMDVPTDQTEQEHQQQPQRVG